MCTKGFKVTVELDVHAVTCPGVWLCPNGRICLKIEMLGFSSKTECLPPVFPLLFHEQFVFEKIISTCRQLTDLQKYLEHEMVHAELVQKAGLDFIEEILLATFEISLLDLLYPSTSRRGVLTGVDIDLLMEPSCHFPGIISPKVEISTKTVVEEVDISLRERKRAYINPRTLRSKTTKKHINPSEKAKIARLRAHPASRCYVHPISHHCFKENDRPPFVVPHKDERDLARLSVHNAIPPLPALTCHRWAGKKQHCKLFRDEDKCKRLLSKSQESIENCDNIYLHDRPLSSQGHCECPITLKNGNCTVCNLYKHYFPKQEPGKHALNKSHRSINLHGSKMTSKKFVEDKFDSSSDIPASRNYNLSEPSTCVTKLSNCGSCSRISKLTNELTRRVRRATCSLEYPFLQKDKEPPCCHHKCFFVSTLPFKDSECCDASQRLLFYKNLESLHNRLYKEAKSLRSRGI